jgi:site-specific DNA recombinase
MRDPQAALYARVSSEQQAHSGTIASQVASLRERIATDGVRLEPEHVFLDLGYSGASLLRPALERLRDAVAAGIIDRVYVHSPDRLARRYAYQVLLVEEFRRAGAEVVFLNRPIGGSAEDDLLLQVQGVIAEYERAKLLERGRRGRRHAARSGSVSALCAAPFGYRYIGKAIGGGVARFEVVEEEARIVRQIFAWVGLERVSLREVCRRLAEAGYRTRTGLARWDPTTVCGMLRNPAYIAQAAFGRSRFVPAQPRLRPIRGRAWPSRKPNTRVPIARDEWIAVPVPALVEPALFAAAQAQLEENRRHRREGRRRPGWLLQGLVVCRRCGYAFYGKTARGKVGGGKTAEYGYYRCLGTDGHRFAGTAPCDNRSVRSDCLELAIWNEIRLLLEDPHRLAAEYRRRLDALHRDAGARTQAAALDRQIEGLRRGIGRLIDSYAEGVIDQHEFQPRIAGLKERLARVREQRQALVEAAEAERSLTLVIGRVEDFAAKVRRSLDELDWPRTREIVRALVRRIEVDGDAIEVVFRVPPLSPDNGPGDAGPRASIPPDRQHCGSGHGGLVGEDADDVGAPLHLLVQALERVRAVQLGPVLDREGQVGEHLVLALVHQRGELGPAGPELVGDLAPGLARRILVGLEESLAQGGGDHGVLALGHVGQGIPHPVDAATLPSGTQYPRDRLLQALVGIGDDQLHALQPAPDKGLEEP